MSHIIIILDEAIEALEAKQATPPTTAQTNLMTALQAANTYTHGSNPDQGVLDQIESKATAIKGYLDSANPPQDNRLQSYADDLNNIVP